MQLRRHHSLALVLGGLSACATPSASSCGPQGQLLHLDLQDPDSCIAALLSDSSSERQIFGPVYRLPPLPASTEPAEDPSSATTPQLTQLRATIAIATSWSAPTGRVVQLTAALSRRYSEEVSAPQSRKVLERILRDAQAVVTDGLQGVQRVSSSIDKAAVQPLQASIKRLEAQTPRTPAVEATIADQRALILKLQADNKTLIDHKALLEVQLRGFDGLQKLLLAIADDPDQNTHQHPVLLNLPEQVVAYVPATIPQPTPSLTRTDGLAAPAATATAPTSGFRGGQ